MLDDEKIIRLLMQPLEKYFCQKDIVEVIAVNGGYIGLKRDQNPWEVIEDSECDFRFWERLCNVISNSRGVIFDEDKQPRLSEVLPDNHRIEAMLGNNVDTKLSVDIRVKRNIKRELVDFGLNEHEANKLSRRIQDGANILLSGATNSGKTSFVNTCVEYTNGDKAIKKTRTLTIEDVREIDLPDISPDTSVSPQYVVSRNEKEATIGYSEIIDHAVRNTPDYIIMGEISVKNAYPAIRMLNTGHKGFFSTIHANSPIDALDGAFVQNVEMSGFNSSNIAKWLHGFIDIVIQLKSRRVVEIFYPEKNKIGESIKFPENEPKIYQMPLEIIQSKNQLKEISCR